MQKKENYNCKKKEEKECVLSEHIIYIQPQKKNIFISLNNIHAFENVKIEHEYVRAYACKENKCIRVGSSSSNASSSEKQTFCTFYYLQEHSPWNTHTL